MISGPARNPIVFGCAAISLALAGAACTAGSPDSSSALFPEEVPDVALLDQRDLYFFIVDRGSKLTRCVDSFARETGGDRIMAKLHAAQRYPALVEVAADVLGSGHPTVQAARANPHADVSGTQGITLELARFGSVEAIDEPLRIQLLRAKALYGTVVEMAGVSDGRCVPAAGLVEAIGRVSPEH